MYESYSTVASQFFSLVEVLICPAENGHSVKHWF